MTSTDPQSSPGSSTARSRSTTGLGGDPYDSEAQLEKAEGAPVGVGVDATPASPARGHHGGAADDGEAKTLADRKDAAAGSPASPQADHPHNDDEKSDVIWVQFEQGDAEDPFNFSPVLKYSLTGLAVLFTLLVSANASSYVPGIALMEKDLNVTNHTLSLFGISIYALGFGIPPLVLAPISEVYGRRWVFLASQLAYTLFFFCTGFADNMATMLLGRFFSGAFGSTGSTLTGGLLADIFVSSDRGTPMAMFATAAIAGTGFGPMWAGWVVQRPSLGWRWVQYIQLIISAGSLLAMCLCLRETRGSVILTRRAIRLRKETGDQRYRAKAEDEVPSLRILVQQSLTRPLTFLAREPIVLFFSLWIATLWGVMYSLLESIGLVTALHGYTPGQTGLVFLSIVVAALLGQVVNIYQNHLYERNIKTRGPEARLYLSMVAALMFPVGCFIYGWTSYAHVSIAGPIVGIVVLMLAVHIVYLAAFNYLADGYLLFASSALAAQSFARNMFGFAVPLFAVNIYENLGYQWASSLAGFLGLLLGVVPFVLFFYGQEIRKRSPASRQLQEIERKRLLGQQQQQQDVNKPQPEPESE
ncbi:unnamed protein product [Parajaminaea phylloscopi]